MNVIFLDFDGVLNGRPFINKNTTADLKREDYESEAELHRAYYECHLNPVCVGMLRQILEQTNAIVVVSSVWRMLNTIEDLRIMLANRGLSGLEHRIMDKTNQKHNGVRGLQIQDYLNTHPEIDKFIIIDDEVSDMRHFMNEVIKTDLWQDGIKQSHVDEAIRRLT
jgi:hypothetical protein